MMIVCARCGVSFEKTGPRSKYCRTCSAKRRAEQNAESRRKYRELRAKGEEVHTCDNQEVVDFCLNCTRSRCIGACDELRAFQKKRRCEV